MHAAPPRPHWEFDWLDTRTHEVPLQQPWAQFVELQVGAPWQTPLVQVPAVHAWQPAPPVPHWEFVCAESATQVVPLQHPAGHVDELQEVVTH